MNNNIRNIVYKHFSFDDDNMQNIKKQSKHIMSTAADVILANCEVGTKLYHVDNKYTTIIPTNGKKYELVGICCADVSMTPDNLPRFAAINDLQGEIDDYDSESGTETTWVDSCWCKHKNGIAGVRLLSWDEADNDFDGYNNTQLLLKDPDCEAANVCVKIMGPDYYLPASAEIVCAHNADILNEGCEYWTSTAAQAYSGDNDTKFQSYAYNWSSNDESIVKSDRTGYFDMHIRPFIHVTKNNVYIQQ